MWLVIDTNIFFDDLRLKKSLDLLFKKIENVHFSLRIPEVVVKETVNIYKEQRQLHLSRLLTSARELKSLTSLDINIDVKAEDFEKDLQAYDRYLREKILSNGDIVPIPDVTLQTLIERDLDRRKPFKEHGVGFRDALIWETILNLVTREGYEGVIFITKNTKDFSEKNDLHPDLIQDLESKGVNPDTVRLFVSVEQFIESLVIPALTDIQEIKDAIAAGSHPEINLRDVTEQYIWDLISGYKVDPDCLPDYQEHNDDVTISWGVNDYEIMVEDLTVKRLSNKELLITASYIMDCEIDVFVPRWDVHDRSFEDNGFSVSDSDWNETYVLANIVLPFKITLRYVYNEEDQDVESADILSAECLKKERD